jgi:molybdenum cofactor cytidylyltransferase
VIQGVLLAAGSASRFGADKLLHPLRDGTPIAVAAARNLSLALGRCLAVVRDGETPLAELLAAEGLDIEVCPQAVEGMGVSLAAGVRRTPNADGWIIALGDMPFIEPDVIRRVADLLRQGAPIAAPAHEGRRGHPVGFARSMYQDLIGLAGDSGARGLLQGYGAALETFETAEPGVITDVDRPGDLAGC